jgi:hydroxymethylbilane synthase
LAKLDAEDSPYSAIILAYAGLARLGWKDRISQVLPLDTFYYAVGQGALAVECREGDQTIQDLLASLEHEETTLKCYAERALMRKLEGGCSVPLGVSSELIRKSDAGGKEEYHLKLRGSVCSLDGSEEIRHELSSVFAVSDKVSNRASASELGKQLGEVLLGKGADVILAKIK